MKTEKIVVTSQGQGIADALTLTEKAGVYAGLDKKPALHLRLLAEELIGLLRGIAGEVEAEVDRALEDLGVVLDEVGLFLPGEGVDADGRPEAPDADRQDGQDDDGAPADFAVVHADPAFRFP